MRVIEWAILAALFGTNKLQTALKAGEASHSQNFELELSERVKFTA